MTTRKSTTTSRPSTRTTKATAKPSRWCVVTTEHRGVFFGNVEKIEPDNKIVLTEAQMCVYWSSDVQGVLGLAATGPSKGCKITPAVPRISLTGMTAIMDCTDAAVEAWKGRPWAR